MPSPCLLLASRTPCARAIPWVSSSWAYPRAPLDDRDDTVEFDFADTSTLSDVDAFKRRRLNGRNGAKHSKRDRAKGRDEIELSWDPERALLAPASRGCSESKRQKNLVTGSRQFGGTGRQGRCGSRGEKGL